MANYIAKTDIETFLNITLQTQGENIVNAIIPAIQALVNNYCNRSWDHASNDEITEKFDGGEVSYFVKNPPIASVVTLTVDGTVYTENSDFYVYDDYIRLSARASNFPKAVVIKYKTSATTVPADVKHAMVQWVAQLFKSQSDAGKVVSRVSAGTVSYDYMTRADMPDFVRMVLNQYRVSTII